MQELRPQTSILRAEKGEGAVPMAPESAPWALPQHILATWIQNSTTSALFWAVMTGFPR